jgi:hypothetical protein
MRNDAPEELSERIKLWEVLNKILKNNGYIDADAILCQLEALKEKLNILLSEVLGVEHTVDTLHNYDDTNIKDMITESIQNINDDLTTLLQGVISTTPILTLRNNNKIDLHTDDLQSLLTLAPSQISIQNQAVVFMVRLV